MTPIELVWTMVVCFIVGTLAAWYGKICIEEHRAWYDLSFNIITSLVLVIVTIVVMAFSIYILIQRLS